MADKYHQVKITGLVVQREGEMPPDLWPQKELLEQIIQQTVEVSCLPLKAIKKRAYSCSICGGRHSSRFCPHKGGAK